MTAADGDRGGDYATRVRGRIDRARRQGGRAMAWVGVGSLAVLIFLGYGLSTALRLGHAEGTRAAVLGISVVVGANLVALALFLRQRKLLDQSVRELESLFAEDGSDEA